MRTGELVTEDPGQDPADETLAARAREGDEAAFELLFERHAPKLRHRVRRELPGLLQRKVAESDVIQMAYLSVHQSLDRFTDRGPGSFRAWLGRIVDHRIADLLRRYVRTGRRSLLKEVSGPEPLSGAGIPGREPTPSLVAVGEEVRQKIEEGIGRLPDDYRRVLQLVEGDGLTLADAGEQMGRSAGAAQQLYARALRQLSRLIRGTEGQRGG